VNVTNVTTIVVADDHNVVRQGVRTLLEAEPAFRVIGEAGDGLEAVQKAEHLRPDVTVLDLMMPGLSDLDVIRQVRQRSPRNPCRYPLDTYAKHLLHTSLCWNHGSFFHEYRRDTLDRSGRIVILK
jgi:CheY-like chemotaxis protein